MNFEPVPKINVVDEIINQFSSLIIQKKMKTGDQLPSEYELMEKLGVGRSSVREALKALEAFGLVERNTGGNYIADPGDDFLYKPFSFLVALKDINKQDLFELRSILEVSNAELAAKRATDKDIEEINFWLKKREEANITRDKMVGANLNFHLSVAKASNNRAMLEVIKSLRMVLAKSQLVTIDDSNEEILYHRKIYEAISKRDSHEAGKLMREHITKIYHRNEFNK